MVRTLTVIALVDLVHEGTPYQAGAVFTVPAGAAVRLMMQRQAKAAPKGSVATPVPTPVPPNAAPDRLPPKKGKSASPKAEPKVDLKIESEAAPSEDRTYQRRDLVPED